MRIHRVVSVTSPKKKKKEETLKDIIESISNLELHRPICQNWHERRFKLELVVGSHFRDREINLFRFYCDRVGFFHHVFFFPG